MEKGKYPLFSNGTEFQSWLANNCDLCSKASRYNEDTDTYTKYRCAIQRDIDVACITTGMGSKRVYDAIRLNPRCPYFKNQSNRRQVVMRHRNNHGQREIDFDNQ